MANQEIGMSKAASALPEINNVVLMVPSVQVDIIRIHEQEPKQDEKDL